VVCEPWWSWNNVSDVCQTDFLTCQNWELLRGKSAALVYLSEVIPLCYS